MTSLLPDIYVSLFSRRVFIGRTTFVTLCFRLRVNNIPILCAIVDLAKVSYS